MNSILKRNPIRMFISNFIWYGFSEAVFRYRLIRKISGDKHVKFRLVNGRDDIICRQCRHFRYCNTNFNSYRKKRMQLYEKYLLNGKLHLPYIADARIIRESEEEMNFYSSPQSPESLILGKPD